MNLPLLVARILGRAAALAAALALAGCFGPSSSTGAASSSTPRERRPEPDRPAVPEAPARPPAPGEDPGPMPRVPETPGAMFRPGPFVSADAFAVRGAELRRLTGPHRVPWNLERGEGIVLVLRGSYDHPGIVDEETWESLAVSLPSARPGRRELAAGDAVYDRSTGWVQGLRRSDRADGMVEVLEDGEDGLRARFDLTVALDQGSDLVLDEVRLLPWVPLEAARRR